MRRFRTTLDGLRPGMAVLCALLLGLGAAPLLACGGGDENSRLEETMEEIEDEAKDAKEELEDEIDDHTRG